LSSYYSAQEFKNNLSLDSKYSAYVKKGAMNKVIIRGFSSRAEAKALAARQFPGAFIVSGSSSSSSYSSTPSYSGSSSSYSTNSSYSSSSVNTNSGIGIQVGAFSSKDRARSVAQSKAGGKYTAIVKTASSRGRTIYKAILLGFSSRADAKRAIASGRFGDAFVVSVH
ncbi:MAG TPA: SPOR domain-containing protein, partial [Campylobacterales bacterium]|nr:SPOR domain-containing protein [Campylobacterales bacterium]